MDEQVLDGQLCFEWLPLILGGFHMVVGNPWRLLHEGVAWAYSRPLANIPYN